MKITIKYTYKLINKYFWKSIIGPVCSFLMPIIFMAIYLIMSNSKKEFSYFVNGLASYISLAILPLSLLSLPSLIIEFRNSILLRKIKTTGMKSYQLILILLSYFLLINIGVILIVCAIFFIALSATSNLGKISHINWGTFFYGLINLLITSLSFGILLSIYAKNLMNTQIIGVGIILITLLLSGQFIPLNVIGTVPAVNYISLISPLSYSANMINIACYAEVYSINHEVCNNIFNLSKPFEVLQRFNDPNGNGSQNIFKTVVVYDIWQKVLFIVMPWVISVSFTVISIRFFKWGNR